MPATVTPAQPMLPHVKPKPENFTVGEGAKRLVEPNEPVEAASHMLRGFAQRQLVLVRGQRHVGRTAHRLFWWPDLGAAKVLRTVTQLGVADNDVLRGVSLACYAWPAGESPSYGLPTPITAALYGCTQEGAHWVFQANLWTDPATGERKLTSLVFDPERRRFPNLPGGAVPLATFLVPIAPWAHRIVYGNRIVN